MVADHDGVIMQETAALLTDLFPGDIPSIFMPYIVFLIDEKQYSSIDAEVITRDFYEMFGIQLDDLVIEKLCNEAISQGYIYELRGLYVSNPMIIKSHRFSKEYEAALNRYQNLKNAYGKYVVEEKGLLPLNDVELDDAMLKIIQNVSIDAVNHSSEDGPPNAYEMALNDFMLYADQVHPEIVDVVNQFAVSDALWSVVANERTTTQPYFKKGAKIFLDTKCIFRLIGLEGDYWKKVFQSFIESINECGGKVIVFKHVMDEVNTIINTARRTYKQPDFDIDRSSAVAREFRFNGYNDAKIDEILYNLNENPALTYDFTIEAHEYERDTEQYQIDYDEFKQLLINTYQETNPHFDLDEKDQTIETDIRSITMTYRIRGDSSPRMVHDADVLFVTTNTSLAQAAKKYDRIHRGKHSGGVPVCFTANYLSTFIWLGRPTNYIKISKQKLLAYCYAAILPTKEQIKIYFEQVNQLKRNKNYSLEQLQYMRENPTLMRLYTLTYSAAPKGQKPTLLESLEQYKQQSSHSIKKLEDRVSAYETKEKQESERRAKFQKSAEDYADIRLKWIENRMFPILPAAISFAVALISFVFIPSSSVKELLTVVSAFIGILFIILGFLLQRNQVHSALYKWLVNRYKQKHFSDILD